MTIFSVIRHAKTQWNMEKRLQGRKDLPLCPQGETDAEGWAQSLSNEPFDIILASPMARARQTADIIAGRLDLDVKIVQDLSEQDFGLWEGKRLKELRRSAPDPVACQESRGWHFCPPKGESRIQVRDRGLAALALAAENFQDDHVLVVTHNSMIKCLIYHCLDRQFSPEEPEVLTPWHLHRFEWDGKPQAMDLNHMDLNQIRP